MKPIEYEIEKKIEKRLIIFKKKIKSTLKKRTIKTTEIIEFDTFSLIVDNVMDPIFTETFKL